MSNDDDEQQPPLLRDLEIDLQELDKRSVQDCLRYKRMPMLPVKNILKRQQQQHLNDSLTAVSNLIHSLYSSQLHRLSQIQLCDEQATKEIEQLTSMHVISKVATIIAFVQLLAELYLLQANSDNNTDNDNNKSLNNSHSNTENNNPNRIKTEATTFETLDIDTLADYIQQHLQSLTDFAKQFTLQAYTTTTNNCTTIPALNDDATVAYQPIQVAQYILGSLIKTEAAYTCKIPRLFYPLVKAISTIVSDTIVSTTTTANNTKQIISIELFQQATTAIVYYARDGINHVSSTMLSSSSSESTQQQQQQIAILNFVVSCLTKFTKIMYTTTLLLEEPKIEALFNDAVNQLIIVVGYYHDRKEKSTNDQMTSIYALYTKAQICISNMLLFYIISEDHDKSLHIFEALVNVSYSIDDTLVPILQYGRLEAAMQFVKKILSTNNSEWPKLYAQRMLCFSMTIICTMVPFALPSLDDNSTMTTRYVDDVVKCTVAVFIRCQRSACHKQFDATVVYAFLINALTIEPLHPLSRELITTAVRCFAIITWQHNTQSTDGNEMTFVEYAIALLCSKQKMIRSEVHSCVVRLLSTLLFDKSGGDTFCKSVKAAVMQQVLRLDVSRASDNGRKRNHNGLSINAYIDTSQCTIDTRDWILLAYQYGRSCNTQTTGNGVDVDKVKSGTLAEVIEFLVGNTIGGDSTGTDAGVDYLGLLTTMKQLFQHCLMLNTKGTNRVTMKKKTNGTETMVILAFLLSCKIHDAIAYNTNNMHIYANDIVACIGMVLSASRKGTDNGLLWYASVKLLSCIGILLNEGNIDAWGNKIPSLLSRSLQVEQPWPQRCYGASSWTIFGSRLPAAYRRLLSDSVPAQMQSTVQRHLQGTSQLDKRTMNDIRKICDASMTIDFRRTLNSIMVGLLPQNAERTTFVITPKSYFVRMPTMEGREAVVIFPPGKTSLEDIAYMCGGSSEDTNNDNGGDSLPSATSALVIQSAYVKARPYGDNSDRSNGTRSGGNSIFLMLQSLS